MVLFFLVFDRVDVEGNLYNYLVMELFSYENLNLDVVFGVFVDFICCVIFVKFLQGDVLVNELVQFFVMSQFVVLKYFKVLENVGLIECVIDK